MIKELRNLGFYYDTDMEMYVTPGCNAWVSFSTTGGEFGFFEVMEDGTMYDNVIKFTVNQLPNLIPSVKQGLKIAIRMFS